MALKLGDLVAYLKTDDSAFRKGLSKSKDDFKSFGQSLKPAVAAGAVAAGVAISAGLSGALSLDSAKAKLAAQLGGSADYAKEMGDVAGKVYMKGFGDSAADAAESVRAVLKSGLLTEDATNQEIEATTIKAQALASAFGQEVGPTARAAGQLIRTGLAQNATQAFDILTKGFQKTGDQADDFLDTITEYSTQFQKMGIDGATATGLLNQGLKAGARDTDNVADAIKEFGLRAVNGTKTTSTALKSLGLDANAVSAGIAAGGPRAAGAFDLVLDRLRKLGPESATTQQAVQNLFGGPGEDLGGALFALDVDKASTSLGKLEGATDGVSQKLGGSASQQLESFKRQVQGALIEKLGAAVPYIRDVGTFLQAHSAVIGPLVGGLGALALVIGTIIGVYKLWTIAQTALNIAQSISPTTWIILGIVALIAVIVLIATKTTWFQQLWGAVWGGIKGAALAVGHWFSGPFAGFFVGAYNKIKGWGETAVGWFKDLPGKLKSALGKVASFLTAPFRSAFNGIAGLWNRTVGGLSFSVPSWVPGIGGNGFSLPKIPQLAKGGLIPATPGGRLVNVGEGREDEAVLPLSKLAGLLGSARTVIELRSGGSRLEELLLEILRDAIDVRGGNVQLVMGR